MLDFVVNIGLFYVRRYMILSKESDTCPFLVNFSKDIPFFSILKF